MVIRTDERMFGLLVFTLKMTNFQKFLVKKLIIKQLPHTVNSRTVYPSQFKKFDYFKAKSRVIMIKYHVQNKEHGPLLVMKLHHLIVLV